MIELKIDTTDLEKKIAQLDTREMQQAIGVAVSESTRDLVAKYPRASGRPQPFTSPQQRRGFFAKLRSGAITVPYVRSGDLGRGWLTEPTGNGAILRNTRPYSDLVQGAKTQAKYFKGVWITDEEAAEKMEQSGDAERIATTVVENHLSKVGLT